MKAPIMETITESLERSLQNFSLNDRGIRFVGNGLERSSSNEKNIRISDITLELNSHISLPSNWKQCLDLKTGEVYYINWKNGMRVKEDPRKVMQADLDSGESYGTLCSEEDDSSYYDSEVSSSESSPLSRENQKDEEDEQEEDEDDEEEVLVVAGCKACFTYFMVPKLAEDCPKCAAQLLHFARPHSPSP